jgi:hypothetical protein
MRLKPAWRITTSTGGHVPAGRNSSEGIFFSLLHQKTRYEKGGTWKAGYRPQPISFAPGSFNDYYHLVEAADKG